MTIGGRFAATGRYTQTYPDVEYDGLQLYVELGYVMASGGAYHISLMPKGDSYQGLLPGNDSNAVSFCNHVKNITSYVPDVSVRLFHEMNYVRICLSLLHFVS